jgi:hypothetical protein
MGNAYWALAGVVIGGFLSGAINYLLQKSQFKHNREMFLLQNKSTEQVKILLADMLNHRSYTDRSFEALRKPIGGFSDDEIRRLLHEIDAKMISRDKGEEFWYLLSRKEERIQNSKK